jgi:hypothetical protein
VFLEAASAKIRCSEAAEKGGAIAHQVHGAIGFTIEHILHRYTLRALAWRDDFGSESYWAVELGKRSPRAAPTNCGRWWRRADPDQRTSPIGRGRRDLTSPFGTKHDRSPPFRSDPPAARMREAAQGSARLSSPTKSPPAPSIRTSPTAKTPTRRNFRAGSANAAGSA